MKRLMFWWVPKIIHHLIWVKFHRTVVCMEFSTPWFYREYLWSRCEEHSGVTITH